MTVARRVGTVRLILMAGVAARALAWGVAAAITLGLLTALADQHAALSVATRHLLVMLAGASSLIVAASLLWRDRAAASRRAVALWIEEHDPSLEYRLVTSIETGRDLTSRDDSAAAWTRTAAVRAARAMLTPALVVAAGVAAILLMPAGALARVATPRPGDSLDRPVRGPRSTTRLAPLVAEITPPRYTAQAATAIDEPSDVRAIVGSTLTLRGRGSPDGIVAAIGRDSVSAVADSTRWRVTLHVGAAPIAIRLTDGAGERIIAVQSVVDSAPVVTLTLPARDTVLRAPRGRLALAADATDDFGLVSAAFELIVSSGEGETFTFRSRTLGAVHPAGRKASLAAALALDSLGLKPGDVLHVRAVARDANDVSGPGVGASETRTIRIARADEYDSVAVDAAPPGDADRSLLSERMLITLAEALDRKRPSLPRASLVSESRAIAADQRQLRRSVGEIVFARLGGEPGGEESRGDDSPAKSRTMQSLLARADSATNRSEAAIDFEGGEAPVVAVNKPLLEAYDAMWDATGALEIGEAATALPHMRRALAAIERARRAERLYLRGRAPQVIVDVARARLQGKDKGASSVRRALTPGDSTRRRRAQRFSMIVELASRDGRAAADSLLLLRVDALGDDAPLAAALGDAASALRRGRAADAASALVRARRLLAGTPHATDSIPRWGLVP